MPTTGGKNAMVSYEGSWKTLMSVPFVDKRQQIDNTRMQGFQQRADNHLERGSPRQTKLKAYEMNAYMAVRGGYCPFVAKSIDVDKEENGGGFNIKPVGQQLGFHSCGCKVCFS